jgi:hypothetical protein
VTSPLLARAGRTVGLATVVALTLASPGCASDAPQLRAEPWPEADALFHRDPRWIGGDGAYTIDLGGGRVLWGFGDSFIASTPARRRDQSRMVRNSVAIQTGYDPSSALMQFYWREKDGEAQSFVPEEGPYWYWPGSGARRGDRVLWFLGHVFQESEGDWGFASGEWDAWIVENPDEEPPAWVMRKVQASGERVSVQLGGAVIVREPWVYVFGEGGDHHDVYLVRFDADRAFDGDLREPSWWGEDGWGGEGSRSPVIDIGAPEFSIHFAAPLGKWVFCATSGFGASTVAIRTAPELSGPWTEPRDIVRPPESFEEHAFVYAAKGHPELTGADFVATYVPSRFDDVPAEQEQLYYYPRFLRVTYP